MNLENLEPQNEDDAVMMAILFQLAKMKQNQKEFIQAIDDFIVDKLDDTE